MAGSGIKADDAAAPSFAVVLRAPAAQPARRVEPTSGASGAQRAHQSPSCQAANRMQR